MKKRFFGILGLVSTALFLVACQTNLTTSTTENLTSSSQVTNSTISNTTIHSTTQSSQLVDTSGPVFIEAVDGFLEDFVHLQNVEVDLLTNLLVADNQTATAEIVIEIVDDAGYDRSLPGNYVITIQARDTAGNITQVQRRVEVIESYARYSTFITLNENRLEVRFNEEDALSYQTSGTKFRSRDVIQVMTKAFFLSEYDKHKDNHTNNFAIPFFPNGVLVMVNEDFVIQQVRIAAGELVEINKDNVQTTGDGLSWNNTIDSQQGGGIFKSVVETIESILPDGGYLIFTGSMSPETARQFLIKNLFYSNYTSGAITLDQQDQDVRNVLFQLETFTEYFPIPQRLETPVIKIVDRILQWNAVKEAGEYLIYVDGVEKANTSLTSFSLESLNLGLTVDEEVGYAIQVEAKTNDSSKWSSSKKSEIVYFRNILLHDLATPVISLNEDMVSWELVPGASSYEVQLSFAGRTVQLAKTSSLQYDLSVHHIQYAGFSQVSIKAIGDEFHKDSSFSTGIEVFLGKVERFEIEGFQVDLIRTGAWNYFARRNTAQSSNKTGFASAPYLFLIMDPVRLNDADFGLSITESFSTLILLEPDGTPKMIQSIIAPNSWNRLDGWYTNRLYKSNSQQMDSILSSLYEGDMLLVGKNGNRFTVETSDYQLINNVNARDFLSHFYVKNNANNDFTLEAWRGLLSTYLDPTDVSFEIQEKEAINPIALETPVLTLEEEYLHWTPITQADEYAIYVDGFLKTTTPLTALNLSSLQLPGTPSGSAGYQIQVVALPSNTLRFYPSTKSDFVEYVQIRQSTVLTKPILTNQGSLLTWDSQIGAVGYEVSIQFAGKTILLDTINATTYDTLSVSDGFEGYNHFFVRAIGDNEYTFDSEESNLVTIFAGKVYEIDIQGYQTRLLVTNAVNYFSRINVDSNMDLSGYHQLPFLFLITDIHQILDSNFPIHANESFSTLILLSVDGSPKLVNSVIANTSWTTLDGWKHDENYASNTAQLDNMYSWIEEGDQLLIGKQDSLIQVQTPFAEDKLELSASSFLSYFFVKGSTEWPLGHEGSLDDMTTFIDSSTVIFDINEEDPVDPEDPTNQLVFNTLKIDNRDILISYNAVDVLNHTPSGAAFRSKDVVQVMSKTHFITQFNQAKDAPGYDTNGHVVYFNSGVLIIIDKDMKVKHLRVGVGITAEVNEFNVLKQSALTWTSATQNATSGGGMFANLVGETLDSLIPDGGYLIFAPVTGSQTARTFLVQTIFETTYISGATSVAKRNVNVTTTKIELMDIR